MPENLFQIILAVAGMLTGGGIVGLFRVRARNTKDNADSAHVLARAYSLLVDDLREASKRQDAELKGLRDELRRVITVKDRELASLRLELAAERTESSHLRQRVTELESKLFALVSAPTVVTEDP